MTSPSYMNTLYNRYRSAMQHRRQQPFWPYYTLPPVAEHAVPAQGNPPAFIPKTNMPDMPLTGYGSYYQSTPNYYRNPVPYTEGDIGAPVPGWGTSVRIAGPARVGVGQMGPKVIATRPYAYDVRATEESNGEPEESGLEEAEKVGGLPWYVWPIAASVVLAGVGYYGTREGWF